MAHFNQNGQNVGHQYNAGGDINFGGGQNQHHPLRLSLHVLTANEHEVYGYFRNFGPGPAFDLRHGVTWNGEEQSVFRAEALGEGESLVQPSGAKPFRYSMEHKILFWWIFCEYSNREHIRFRIQYLVAPNPRQFIDGPKLFVWHEENGAAAWRDITPPDGSSVDPIYRKK